MRYKKTGPVYILRIDRGEEIVETLRRFCAEQKITLGTVQGIGAAGHVEIGLFETAIKEDHTTTLTGDFEITSLLGSITTMDGAPYLHLHANIAGASFHASGGHLSSAVVSGTCEIFIYTVNDSLERTFDADVGLNVFDL